MCRSFARPTAVLKERFPLSMSTQTTVECGEPSLRRVVATPTNGCSRNCAWFWSSSAMFSPPVATPSTDNVFPRHVLPITADLLIGTKKGLSRLDDGRLGGPLLTGCKVHHAVNVGDTIFAASNSRFVRATVQRSTDGGETWERAAQLGLPEESGLTLTRVW